MLLSDTVGFVRRLPHQLVEAFRSTLEEVVDADMLVHVVDGSSYDAEDQIEAVHTVLREIGADGVPELLVVNKTDVAEPRRGRGPARARIRRGRGVGRDRRRRRPAPRRDRGDASVR